MCACFLLKLWLRFDSLKGIYRSRFWVGAATIAFEKFTTYFALNRG